MSGGRLLGVVNVRRTFGGRLPVGANARRNFSGPNANKRGIFPVGGVLQANIRKISVSGERAVNVRRFARRGRAYLEPQRPFTL